MRGFDGVCGPCRKGAGGARGACGGNADGAHVGWPQKVRTDPESAGRPKKCGPAQRVQPKSADWSK